MTYGIARLIEKSNYIPCDVIEHFWLTGFFVTRGWSGFSLPESRACNMVSVTRLNCNLKRKRAAKGSHMTMNVSSSVCIYETLSDNVRHLPLHLVNGMRQSGWG